MKIATSLPYEKENYEYEYFKKIISVVCDIDYRGYDCFHG